MSKSMINEKSIIVGRVDTQPELDACLLEQQMENFVFQKLDLTPFEERLLEISSSGCLIPGCTTSPCGSRSTSFSKITRSGAS